MLGLRMALIVTLVGLMGCGFVRPGTPGHEPPSAGPYNYLTHERTN